MSTIRDEPAEDEYTALGRALALVLSRDEANLAAESDSISRIFRQPGTRTPTEQEHRAALNVLEKIRIYLHAKGPSDEYLDLVRAFPLVSIRDDMHLADALVVLDRLIDKPERSPAAEAYLGALTDLVETYERIHVVIPDVTGVAALRALMEENGLTQADLVPLFGTPSVVSEVLAGKRRLALSHIRRLAAHFGLPADAFIDRAEPSGQTA